MKHAEGGKEAAMKNSDEVELIRERLSGGAKDDSCLAVRGSRGSYLRNVHDGVAAEGSGRGQVVEAQQSGDNAVLINPANHGPIHKEDYTVLIHRNACRWVDSRRTERENIYQPGLGVVAA